MGAYDPEVPAKRPGGKPNNAPKYRILVHRKYEAAWNQIVERVGMQQAQQFWDHVAYTPGIKDPIAKGFSKTIHYELSSMARINYQYCDEYQTSPDRDKHHVVFILSIDYSSH